MTILVYLAYYLGDFDPKEAEVQTKLPDMLCYSALLQY